MLRNGKPKPHRVIVVDDDPINAMLLAEICNAAAWEVSGCASCTVDAIEMVRQCKPRCLIVDYKLDGDRTGLDLIADVKAHSPDLFTIMVTGWDINDIASQIDGPQPDRILRKPIPPHILMDMLDGIVPESNVVEIRRA